MIDPRFYDLLGPVPAHMLAAGGQVDGDPERAITGLAALDEAGPDDLAYFDGKGAAPANRAGALILKPNAAGAPHTAIRTRTPRAHFARVVRMVAAERRHAGPAIASDALIEEGVSLGPGVVIGPGAQIGAGTGIEANAVIGPGVAIGRRVRIGAGVSVMCALIGDDVTLLAGARIGQAGFGVAGDEKGTVDVPHFGRAILQDGVSIGANSTVDRGLFGDTVIAEGAKIDNLCHIAHNVMLGRGVLIAAFGGISGSVIVGDGVVMGGRVGIADHKTVGAGAQLAAGSAVLHDVPAGETWAGYPAKPLRQWLRETAWLSRAIGKRDGGDS